MDGKELIENNPASGVQDIDVMDQPMGGQLLASDSLQYGDWYVFYHDLVGTKRAEADDGSGELTQAYLSLPYGESLGWETYGGVDVSNKYFAGQPLDTLDSQLSDFGARYYKFGQFVFMTPEYSMNSAIMEFPQTWNKYSYDYGRPTFGSDPNGYCPPCVGALIGGVVEGGIDLGKQFFQNQRSFNNFNSGEFWGAVGGGAIAGAIAGATGGTSLLASATVGDLAGGTIGNLIGGVAERGITSALSGGSNSDDVLSGAKISQDALAGFIGGGVAHLAGDFVHIPGDPVHNGTGITGRAVTDPAAFGKINRATLRQMSVSALPGSWATHQVVWSFPDLFYLPPAPCAKTGAYDSHGNWTGWSACQ